MGALHHVSGLRLQRRDRYALDRGLFHLDYDLGPKRPKYRQSESKYYPRRSNVGRRTDKRRVANNHV